MENKEIEIKGRGIKVNILSRVFIIIGAITMITSIFMMKRIFIRYDDMMNSYQFEETEREAAYNFKDAFNYLSDQSRQFVVSGDAKYAENYFKEKDVIKRREAAIEIIDNSHILELESSLLRNAMELSENLVEQDIHAMSLVAHAMNLDASLLPDEIVSYELPQDELAFDSFKQQNLAVQLINSSEYEDYVERINWDINNAITLIKDESETRYREAQSDLMGALNITALLIFVMFILVMLIFEFNTMLVVKPAEKFVELLDKNQKLPEIGGYEFRDFARKYNDIYRSNKKNIELLKEQGEVDELTGTLKPSTLEFVRHNLSQHNEPLGIMMIDIDNFRSIKEANGYDMADKLVAKVANLFTSTFKSSDYMIRTGKDTFEMYLLRMKPADSDMLVGMITEINEKLKDSSDGVAAATVSVGVAFSDNGYNEETEKNADMALNYVKENGKGTCKIS